LELPRQRGVGGGGGWPVSAALPVSKPTNHSGTGQEEEII
jgi:hypothetical protein